MEAQANVEGTKPRLARKKSLVLLFIAACSAVIFFAARMELVARAANSILLGGHFLSFVVLNQVFYLGFGGRQPLNDDDEQRNAKLNLLALCGIGFAAWISWISVSKWSAAQRDQSATMTVVSALIATWELTILWLHLQHRRLSFLLASGNHQAALQILRPRLTRKNVGYWDLICAADLLIRLGQEEEGSRLIEQGLEKSSRNPIALSQVASICYFQRRYQEGLVLTDEGLSTLKHQPVLLFNRCLFLVELGRLEEAHEAWDQLKAIQDPEKLIPKNSREGMECLARIRATLASEV